MAIVLAIIAATIIQPAAAQSPPSRIGIVIMHGKGGTPTKHVADLAAFLEGKGYLVANLEMPWSGRRGYDVSVAGAEQEVVAALDSLRAKGATKLFVAGHSQGGLFALYFGGKHPVDGIVAMAPGGSVNTATYLEKLGESVAQARKLVADGKGDDKTSLLDFEGSKGTYSVLTTPAIYLGWFEPDGAMNQSIAAKNLNPQVPVLYIAPTGDYPGLKKAKQALFDALPRHPLTRLYEPESSHLGAPSAAADEILRWTTEVANSANTADKAMSASGRP
ncbi:MAG: alpha/beta hydrolase [Hydrogenophilaceae bacterium]|nr:alpha/beta hydrolase [Hydrogenophilaceae bacterium]